VHPSFDLYPSYLRSFATAFDPEKPYRLKYDLHAQRNYVYVTKNGKRVPEPQVRPEGSLEIDCFSFGTAASSGKIAIRHVREWSIWTDQDFSSRQIIDATIHYKRDATGSLRRWEMSYTTEPVPPPKPYRFNKLESPQKNGAVVGRRIRVSGMEGSPPASYPQTAPATSLYTLIDTLSLGAEKKAKVDLMDDLTMYRPGLELVALGESTVAINGEPTVLHGNALVGAGTLPFYFWKDAEGRVLAVIGRNVAYTLTSAENL
jgi:hypothetical protein